MVTFIWPPQSISVTVPPIAYTESGINTPVTPDTPLPVVNTISVKEYIPLDISGLDSSAWIELTTTASKIKKLQIFSPTDKALLIGIGAAASEIATAVIFPGGCDIDLAIDSGERVSIQTVTGTVAVGTTLYANLLG